MLFTPSGHRLAFSIYRHSRASGNRESSQKENLNAFLLGEAPGKVYKPT
jgi:hypothetical protein